MTQLWYITWYLVKYLVVPGTVVLCSVVVGTRDLLVSTVMWLLSHIPIVPGAVHIDDSDTMPGTIAAAKHLDFNMSPSTKECTVPGLHHCT